MSPNLGGFLALIFFSLGNLCVALSGDMPAFQLSAMVLLSCALTLWLYFKFTGKNIRASLNLPASQYIITLLGIGGYQILVNSAFKMAPAFEMNILNYLWPILLVLFSKFKHQQALKKNECAGMALGFIGMCVIFMPQNGTAFNHIGAGHFVMIAAAVIWAFYSAFITGKKSSVALLIPVTAFSGGLCLMIHLLFEETIISMPVIAWIAVAIYCLTRFSYALWDFGMRKGDQMLLSSLSYFLPLLSCIYFIAFGIMPVRIEVAIGGAFIIIGCIIVNWHRIIFFKKNK